ncbi:sulfate adenylyltransferase subunit CysN [bacterium]|nr:sulfate adenylyltransferase subunit CysN [bacterium]
MIKQNDLIGTDIISYLAQHERKELLRFITCGSVDDGKSTLIGRLLHDSKLIYEDQLAAVTRDSKKVGTTGDAPDLALLVDGLQAEREQGITIDVAYRFFSTDKRKFIIADTPGHEQYTRNMATGASTADLAIILIDARHGILTQTRRHSFIASLLGIRHIVVAINKMDLMGFSEEVFTRIRQEYEAFASQLGFEDVVFIPISALKGDNVVDRSSSTDWYDGPTLLGHLETVHIGSDRNFEDFRFPVQFVNRPNLNFRGYCGCVASGIVRKGDEVVAHPSGVRTRVKSIVTMSGEQEEAFPPQAVTLTLESEIDLSRGEMLSHVDNQPTVARDFEAMIVWMNADALVPGRPYLFKVGTNMVSGTVHSIRFAVDVNTLQRGPAQRLELNQVARCQISLNRSIPFDDYNRNRQTGAFIVIDRVTNVTVGAGMIRDNKRGTAQRNLWDEAGSAELERKSSRITPEERAQRYHQKPVTILITGLNASGKSLIALELERRLFDSGKYAVLLEGAAMRLGISKDLGYTYGERSENLRRAAEIARINNDSGLITIASFVAPDADVRARVKELIGAERFIEVHVNMPVEKCRERDTKGLYKRADAGELEQFPGVSAPYQAPTNPDLVLPTHELSIADCVDRLVALLEQRGIL